LKSLYYCRSTSIQRADKVSNKTEKDDIDFSQPVANNSEKYEECLACQ
jgi:ribonucleoside-diphosphate reductase alpha chain